MEVRGRAVKKLDCPAAALTSARDTWLRQHKVSPHSCGGQIGSESHGPQSRRGLPASRRRLWAESSCLSARGIASSARDLASGFPLPAASPSVAVSLAPLPSPARMAQDHRPSQDPYFTPVGKIALPCEGTRRSPGGGLWASRGDHGRSPRGSFPPIGRRRSPACQWSISFPLRLGVGGRGAPRISCGAEDLFT